MFVQQALALTAVVYQEEATIDYFLAGCPTTYVDQMTFFFDLHAAQAPIDNLSAARASIDNLSASQASIDNLNVAHASMDNLHAAQASIDNLSAVPRRMLIK